jgi:hypothetical protein
MDGPGGLTNGAIDPPRGVHQDGRFTGWSVIG